MSVDRLLCAPREVDVTPPSALHTHGAGGSHEDGADRAFWRRLSARERSLVGMARRD